MDCIKPYRLQLVQKLYLHDKDKRFQFCSALQLKKDDFVKLLIFSDEATFHTNGKVNRHNCRIWETQNPHDIVEHEQDSPNVNVFCAMSRRKLCQPLFFEESIVTGQSFLAMLQNWLMPLLKNDSDNFVLQLDRAPPHFHRFLRTYLTGELPNRWIDRGGATDQCLLKWPPRSSDIIACDFFLWGYVKDFVYIPPLPRDLVELKRRIAEETATVSEDMLDRVWQEFDYRVDISQVIHGSHLKYL